MKKARTRLEKINSLIFILHIVFPVWMIFLMYTMAVSGYLFLTMLAAVLLLGAIYRAVNYCGKGRKILYAARIITALLIVAFYMPSFILMSFKETELLYPLKRACYIYGVYGGSEFYDNLLPEKLPDKCGDYYCMTQGCVPAQDYHPSSYLMFHTDRDTLDSYAEYYSGFGYTLLENNVSEDEEDNSFDRIEWFCSQMRISERFSDNLDNAVLYYIDDYYPKGILLNYETGLVAILT